MSGLLEIQTLGGLAIKCDGQPVAGLGSRKAEALLVYLAYTRHMHPREVLAEMLWEERPQAQSCSNLRGLLTVLRQQLGAYVEITRESVGMNALAPCRLDAAEMERLLATANQGSSPHEAMTRLQDAIDLYRGDFLEGFFIDSNSFETWALLERERLRFRVMEALDVLIAHALAQREHSTGIACATRLLQMDSLREKTHRQLMMLLLHSGQREAALAQYEVCRRLLHEEMGIEPTAETRALVDLLQAGQPLGAPASQAVAVSSVPTWPTEALVNPYKGLRAFQEADAPDFFGRETLTERLVARLAEEGPYSRFLAVVGPSGCGKSSVVRAGLIPALRGGALPGSEKWAVIQLVPGAHPLDELDVALARLAGDPSIRLLDELRGDPRGLLRVVRRILPDKAPELLLVIDQFEEVFTLAADPAETTFLMDSLFAAVTEPRSPLRVVIALRADFYDRPLMHAGFGSLLSARTQVVLPLTAEEIERAIRMPLERTTVSLEPGLAAAIVAEVNAQPGALPLLQYALTELFDHRVNHLMTWQVYHAIGRTVGALAQRAEQLCGSLNQECQDAMRQIFLRLVTLGEGVEDTRRRAHLSELLSISRDPSAIQQVMTLLDHSRLLTFDHDPVAGEPTVEIAHEALLREWPRLRTWLDESRDDLFLQRVLSAAASDWDRCGRDPTYLLTGSRLARFEDWAARTDLALTPEERALVEASVAEHRRQRARRRRVRNAALTAALAIALIMSVLSLVALDRERKAQDARARAEREASVNHSIVLGNQAQSVQRAGYTDLALALALEAVRIDDPPPDITGILGDIAFSDGTRFVIQAHHYTIKDVAISPDERWGVSASCGVLEDTTCLEGELILWDVRAGTEIRRFAGHTDWVTGVTFSPDGQTILSGSADKTLILWNASTGEILRRFEGHTGAVNSVAFSPDGQTILSGSADTTLILWDATTGELLRRFEGHTGAVNSVAFSPDGTKALSGSGDTTMILWDVMTGQALRRFEGHTDVVNSVAFSPDAKLILSGDQGSWVRIYNAQSGEENLGRPHTYGEPITDIAISASGNALFGGTGSYILFDLNTLQDSRRYGGDYLARAWSAAISASGQVGLIGTTDGLFGVLNLKNQAEIRRFGIGTPGYGLAISPDGQYLVTGNVSQPYGEAVLWDLKTGQERRRLKIPNSTSVFDATFTPDGKYVLLAVSHMMGDAEAPSRVVVWEVATGAEIPRFTQAIEGWTLGIAISPDGRLVLTSSASMAPDRVQGGLILWDMETGQKLRQFSTENTGQVVFSADGSRALSGTYWGSDGHISLWDVATGQEIRRFEGGHKPGDAAFPVAFGPGETTVISGSADSTLVEWDVATGKILRRFIGHDGAIWGHIGISRDGRYMLSASFGDVILWDFATGAILHHFHGYTNWGNVLFAPDEQTAFTATGSAADGVIEWKIANMPLDDLLAWISENRYVRDFTCEERALYRIEPLCE